jgi:hypothetical protein
MRKKLSTAIIALTNMMTEAMLKITRSFFSARDPNRNVAPAQEKVVIPEKSARAPANNASG